MKVVCDTGPLVAAADRRDSAHRLARGLVTGLGRDLLLPDPVVVETDQFLRTRGAGQATRRFLSAVSAGEHALLFLTPGLLRRAVEIDDRYRDLNLGLTDAVVMACAERHDLPIFTFDFRDFRATAPEHGEWRLLVSESQYREAVGR